MPGYSRKYFGISNILEYYFHICHIQPHARLYFGILFPYIRKYLGIFNFVGINKVAYSVVNADDLCIFRCSSSSIWQSHRSKLNLGWQSLIVGHKVVDHPLGPGALGLLLSLSVPTHGLHLVLQLRMRPNVDVALLSRRRSRWLCDYHLVEVIIHKVVVVMACVHAPVLSLNSLGQHRLL